MADKKFVANNETRSQARKINSMSATLNKLEAKVEGQQQIVSTTNRVLGKLAGAVETATSSIERVATNAIRYTKDTLDQYSKQIGQDISINKKNLVALALTGATPIFGYFAAKFMETDVFQTAIKNIKEKLGNAVMYVVDKVKGIITGTWGGLKRIVGLKKKEPFTEKIPKMAKGGYISKGGLTRLHAAEVVMPIDKLLDRIDEKIESRSEGRINLAFKKFGDQQQRTSKNLITASKEGNERISKDIVKLDASNRLYNREILESLSDIQVALAGYSKGIREWLSTMFQNFLLRHPAIRFIYSIGSWFMGKVRGLINFPFVKRGGYKKFLSKDPNAFNATRDILATTFVFSMDKYDEMIQLLTQQLTATQDMASAFTGKRYKTTLHKTYPEYTIAGALFRLAGRGVRGIGKIAAWEYQGVKKMLGKGGKTGTKLPSQEISLVNITDKFGLLLEIQIKILHTLKKMYQSDFQNGVRIKKNFEKTESYQKRLLRGHLQERKEAKKEEGWLKKISSGVSEFGDKLKLLAKRTGSYIWDAIKWVGSIIGGLAGTIWSLVPNWLKAALGIGGAAYIGTKIGETINDMLPTFANTIKEAIQGGKKGAREFEEEDKAKRKKEWAEAQKMSPWEIWKKMFTTKPTIGGVKEWESKYGIPGQKATMAERMGTTLVTQLPKFAGIDIMDVQQRNLHEKVKKEELQARYKSSLNFLQSMQNKMSPDAFSYLSTAFRNMDMEKNPQGVFDIFQQLQLTGTILKNKDKKWVLKDEYFEINAPLFTEKLPVKALEKIGIGEQLKDAYVHALKADEARQMSEKAFAGYIKKKSTPEAYAMLTKFGTDNISDKFSSMVINNQLIEHDGKLNTAYQYLSKTNQLDIKDRFKYIFGIRNIPPSELINLLGIKPLVYAETAEAIMAEKLKREREIMSMPGMLGTMGIERQLSNISNPDIVQAVQQSQMNEAYLQNLQTKKPITSVLSEFGEDFMKNFVEHASEIRENYIMPSIENAKIIGMDVKKEMIKQQAAIRATEEFKDMAGRIEGAQNAIVNTINNNMVNNSNPTIMSTSGPQQQPTSTMTDPNVQSILTGDLR